MPEQSEKLLHFTDTVIQTAVQESQELSGQIEKKLKDAIHEERMAAFDKAQAYYEKESARIRAEASREVSRFLMEGKRKVYLRRQEIAEEVFGKVREKISSFTQSEEYPDHMKYLLQEALQNLDDGVTEIVLRLRKEDLKLGPMLTEAAAPLNVEVQEGGFYLGGLSVRCPQRKIRIDCTFDQQLKDLYGHFAELFGLSLSDELDET